MRTTVLFYFFVFISVHLLGQEADTLLFNEIERIEGALSNDGMTAQKDFQLKKELSSLYDTLSVFYLKNNDLENWQKTSKKNYDLFIYSHISAANEQIQRDIDLALKYDLQDNLVVPFYTRLAYTEKELRLFSSAIDSYEKALGRIDKEKKKEYIAKYIDLPISTAYGKLNDLESAIKFQKRSIEILENTPLSKELYFGYNNLGEYYFMNKEYDKGLIQHRKIRENNVLDQMHYHFANAYSGISKIHMELDNLDSARYYLDQAKTRIDLEEIKDSNLQELELEVLKTEAELFESNANLDMAESSYLEYLRKGLSFFTEEQRERARTYNVLAGFYYRNEHYEKAKKYYEKALNEFKVELIDPQLLDAKMGIVQSIYNGSKTINKAHLYERINECLEIYVELNTQYNFDESKQELSESIKRLTDIAIELLFEEYRENPSDEIALKALEYFEKAKANILFDAQSNNILLAEDNSDKSILIKQWKKQLSLIEDQLYKVLENGDVVKEEFFRKEKENIETELASISLDQKASSKIYNFRIEDLIERFSFDALLAFQRQNQYLYSIAYQNGEFEFRRIILESELKMALESYQKQLTFEHRHNFDKENASYLFQALWPQQFFSENQKVLTIPDEGLYTIPFEAFYTSDSYLVEDYTLSYSNSIRLSLAAKNDNTNNKIIAFAPQYEGEKQLEKSEEELLAIEKIFEAETYSKQNNLKKIFKSKVKDYSIIHISSHAKLDTSIDQSYIMFDHEKLYLDELYSMQINSNLVFLGACETNLGEMHEGEGLISLSRGFNYTGVPACISSLWKINERSSLEISSMFYQNLNKAYTISEALSAAKRDYLKNTTLSQEYKTPYYWAGLNHYGSNYTLDIKKSKKVSTTTKWILILLGLIGITSICYWRKR